MADERKVREATERAQQAQAVLNNEAYQGAYDLLERQFFNAWKVSDTPEQREDLHRQMVALSQVRAVLDQAMRHGEAEIKFYEAERQRRKRSGGET